MPGTFDAVKLQLRLHNEAFAEKKAQQYDHSKFSSNINVDHGGEGTASGLMGAAIGAERLKRAKKDPRANKEFKKDFEKNLVGTAELLASIHSLGVIHGDPTTSNFIVNEKIHAIDFGLAGISEDDEARASDLRVLLESLDSHHSEISGRDIFLKAYSNWTDSSSVLEALKVLELRGRYNLMRG